MAANETSRSVVRWTARLTGAGSLWILLLFVGAHLFEDSQGPGPTAAEWLGLMFFPTGVIIGLFVAFFRAKAGALTAIGSLAAFYAWHLAHAGSLPGGPYFALFTSPAILFLISGLLDDGAASENREPDPSEKRPEEPGCGLGTAS